MTSDRYEPTTQLERLNQATARTAALVYASSGWAVFPVAGVVSGHCGCRFGPACAHPGKHPLLRNGLHGATTDPEMIERWWRRWPWAGIGLATGARSKLVVVDIDPGHGGDTSEAELGGRGFTLPETLTVRTGGGGRHLLYRHPGGLVPNCAGRLPGVSDLPGIDLRGDGGYIVAAPSAHSSGGRYQWDRATPIAILPGWAQRQEEVARVGGLPAGEGRTVRYGLAALEAEVGGVRGAQEGQRNVTLNRAAFKLGTLVGAGVLDEVVVCQALTEAGQTIGLDAGEVVASIRSGLTAGLAHPRALTPGREHASHSSAVSQARLYSAAGPAPPTIPGS